MFDVLAFGALVALLSLAAFASVDARRITSSRQPQAVTIIARMRHR